MIKTARIPETQAHSRDIDPSVRQRRAADPLVSAWVGASAGTGKTKVLTDRVLRLLLPRADGSPGTLPHRIFCLTFTKAAASEMALRINRTLGDWAVKDEEDLSADLAGLTGAEPSSVMLEAARELFAKVVDTPGGFKIMTIHAFCQSVLARFPLEAGITPQFTVIDEVRSREYLQQARDIVLNRARQNEQDPLNEAVYRLASAMNEDMFSDQLSGLISERLQLAKTGAPDALRKDLRDAFGLQENDDEDAILAAACCDMAFDSARLWQACRYMGQSRSKTDRERSVVIQSWLECDEQGRREIFDDYARVFLTGEGEKRVQIATKSLENEYEELAAILETEAFRLIAVKEEIKAARCVTMTADLFMLGQAITAKYEEIKTRLAVLDYDDLVLKTRNLLRQDGIAPWVLYKLDGGLDHILIDEAQDTNPEQWEIIDCLCADFYAGEGTHAHTARTVFTVGDEKQSIYSFQRAAPREFERMRAHFKNKIECAGARWHDESLSTSFRSVESVLQLVDEVFAPAAIRSGLGREIEEHVSYRTRTNGAGGLCEIWPLFEPDKAVPPEPWSPPTQIIESISPQSRLADAIGAQIRTWLDEGEILESQGRPIRPGDILILVRTRTAFVAQLVRALKTRNIPVSGLDRMVLGEQIAVMDLLAAARFALLPDDDLSLACLLKSPFIGWDDNDLYNYACGRDVSLWRKIEKKAPDEVKIWLQALIRQAGNVHPYEFFSALLQSPCPANRYSGMMAMLGRLGEDIRDPLDEFLNKTLFFESDNVPDLQKFMIWQQQDKIEIKREMEEAHSEVRIMTVHGAKGLQAPIVFLPDSVRNASSKRLPRLLWPDKTGLTAPLYAPRKEEEPPLYRQAKAQVEAQLDEEYRRLLYVAMTRAEDRLYICGAAGQKKPLEESWYYYIERAFDRLEDVQEVPVPGLEKPALRIYNPQRRSAPIAEASPGTEEMLPAVPVPPWLYEAAPAEPEPPRPLIPSRPSEPEPSAASPLSGKDAYRFQRGNLTHKLLQFLPDLSPDRWRVSAENLIGKAGQALPERVQRGIVDETLAILENPDYAPLFGPGSMAEVPLTGMAGHKLVSGQIDRLYVGEDRIMIIDYKTNRPPPAEEKDVPAQYMAQMRAYRDTLREIYTDRPVHCYLLWTDGPRLMRLTELG